MTDASKAYNKANTYRNADTFVQNQNELEARALIKTASMLNHVKENWEDQKHQLNAALDMNRKLWTILVGNINDDDNPLPLEIKQNVANLAYFIFKRTVDVMAAPRKNSLDALININMNIAKGLYETNGESSNAKIEDLAKQEQTPPSI
jgi:flagellar protein FlaF